ncbi:hypothetical protein ACFM35_00050 [Microbacterium sp. P01]|uniref:hypothetical protein n=1 Tax=Microbacterium sp. P01 TaxID=3366261 RepID=UPI00366E2183
MGEIDLDSELRAAARPTSGAPRLAYHRDRILAEARNSRRHVIRLWGVSLAATVILVGGGTAAMAGAGMETPWGWIADNVLTSVNGDGTTCFQGWEIRRDGLAEEDPIVQDAQDLIRGLDLTTLDTTAMETVVREDYANAIGPNGELSPIYASDAEVKRDAISRIVAQTVFDGLLERGHAMSPGHEVSISSQSTVCD